MSDFWGSILSALGIGGDSTPQQQSPSLLPPSGGQGSLGVTQAQIPSWDQYNKDRSSFGGILTGMLGHGIGPGLQEAFQPDSMAMQSYNAALGQGQAVGIQGIGIPRQQFTADILSGKRDAKTGAWLGSGPDPMAAQQQPSYAPQAPQMPGQGTPVTGASLLPPQGGAGGGSAPAGGGLLAPPGSQPPADDSAPPTAMPASYSPAAPAAPVAASMPHTMWGAPRLPGYTDREQLAFMSADPKGYETALTQYLSAKRGGSSYPDMATGKMVMAPQGIPGVPGTPGDQGYNQGVTQFEAAKSQGGVGPAIQIMSATQRAEQAKSEALANQAYRLKTGQGAPGDVTAAPRTAGGPLSTGGPAMPAPAPQPTAAPPSASPQNAGMKGEDFQTDRGTVVPSPKNQTIKQGEIQYKNQADASQKTEESWNAIRPQIDTTRARILSTSKVLAQTQAGGLDEAKATASRYLDGLGMDWLSKKVMSADDRAGVQTILWNSMQEALSYLKQQNAGTGGKILATEFNNFLEHGYSPDMEPKMLREGITQLLGGSYQTGNMIDDWHGPAQKMNWQDANQFQSNYLRKNPLENFIGYANKELPTFKGMEAGPKPGQGSPYSRAEIEAELARRKAAKAGGS